MRAPPPRHLVQQILLDAAAIYRCERWAEALERCKYALDEQRQRKNGRAIGATLTIDMLAGDVAKLIGADITGTRAVARDVLLDSPAAAIARELADFRQELIRERRAG